MTLSNIPVVFALLGSAVALQHEVVASKRADFTYYHTMTSGYDNAVALCVANGKVLGYFDNAADWETGTKLAQAGGGNNVWAGPRADTALTWYNSHDGSPAQFFRWRNGHEPNYANACGYIDVSPNWDQGMEAHTCGTLYSKTVLCRTATPAATPAPTTAPAAATSSIKKIMFTFPNGMAIRYSSFDLYDSNNNNVLSAFTDGGLTASSGNTVYVGQIVDGVCAGSKAHIGGSAGGDSGAYRWFDDCGSSGTDWITSTGATDYRCKSWCHPWIDLFNSGANACLLLTFASPVSGAFTDAVVAGYSPEVTNKASTIVHVAYDNAPDTFVEVGSETNPSITAMGQSECGYPTSAYKIPLTVQAPPMGASGSGAAVGDPHLQNIHGERFDLMKEGKHVLISIPRGKDAEDALLRVQADARRLGGHCADMYFQKLNITGSWAEAKKAGGYHYSASQQDPEAPAWIAFGKVEVKVAHGRTDGGLLYLNVYVKHLRRAGFAIGGLLGEDDHEDVITPPEACAGKMALLDSEGDRRSVASLAAASFE